MNAMTEQDHWLMITAELMANEEVVRFVRTISSCEIEVVEQSSVGAANSTVGRCHLNVREQVEQQGGKQVYGWQIATERTEGATLKGCVYAMFHSCWKEGNGVLWDITDAAVNTRLFLPDPLRQYDYENEISYNNRVVFLSDYECRNAMDKVAKNKTYYTAKGYKSRDTVFEKYKRPKSLEEVHAALPQKYRTATGEINPAGYEWLCLKYAVSMRH